MKPANSLITDTIIAQASAPGPAGVAVIRISGPKTKAIVSRLHTKGAESFKLPRQLLLGQLHDGATIIDKAFVVAMPSPQSYTGEDVAELHVHGSPAIVRALMQAATKQGARLAEPGEFTKRAFLNGQLDLAQAEAVADVIAAETSGALAMAEHQLAGELSKQIEQARAEIVAVTAEVSAWLDFSEEDLAEIDREGLALRLKTIGERIYDWIKSASRGALVRDGVVAVIVGLPNAGKSSLLNALAGYERAIVTEIAGTTRDSLEERIEVDGLMVRLVDTAGITATEDVVETIGVRRAQEALRSAGVVLLTASADQDMKRLKTQLEEANLGAKVPIIGVQTKIDLGKSQVDWPVKVAQTVATSAKTGKGLDDLREAILEAALGGQSQATPLVANGRHVAALEEGLADLAEAQLALESGASLDVVSGQLMSSAASLSTILGVSVDQELVNAIFSKFCIGK